MPETPSPKPTVNIGALCQVLSYARIIPQQIHSKPGTLVTVTLLSDTFNMGVQCTLQKRAGN